MSKDFPLDAIAGDVFNPAMEVQTEAEAEAYLQRIVHLLMCLDGSSAADARAKALKNITEWTGYSDSETAARVMALYHIQRGAMTLTEAKALVATISDSDALPIRQGWHAETRLLLRPDEAGQWDGKWCVLMEHRNSNNSYVLTSAEDWRLWHTGATLFEAR